MRVKSVQAGSLQGGRFVATQQKSNPAGIPSKFAPAKVRRLANGDVQVLLEQAPARKTNPKKKARKTTRRKTARKATRKASTKRRK